MMSMVLFIQNLSQCPYLTITDYLANVHSGRIPDGLVGSGPGGVMGRGGSMGGRGLVVTGR